MPIGIELYNSDGSTLLSVDSSVATNLGTYPLDSGSASSGSVYVPGFANGTGWYYAIPTEQSLYQGYEVDVWISGLYLYWQWPSTYRNATDIIYGIY